MSRIKVVALILCFCVLFCFLVGCDNKAPAESNPPTNSDTVIDDTNANDNTNNQNPSDKGDEDNNEQVPNQGQDTPQEQPLTEFEKEVATYEAHSPLYISCTITGMGNTDIEVEWFETDNLRVFRSNGDGWAHDKLTQKFYHIDNSTHKWAEVVNQSGSVLMMRNYFIFAVGEHKKTEFTYGNKTYQAIEVIQPEEVIVRYLSENDHLVGMHVSNPENESQFYYYEIHAISETIPPTSTIADLLSYDKYHSLIAYKVMSNSMEPTFHVGDTIIFDKECHSYEVGDIVLFEADLLGDGSKVLLAHRIVQIVEEYYYPTQYITKGDNNLEVDPFHLTVADIIAVYKP